MDKESLNRTSPMRRSRLMLEVPDPVEQDLVDGVQASPQRFPDLFEFPETGGLRVLLSTSSTQVKVPPIASSEHLKDVSQGFEIVLSATPQSSGWELDLRELSELSEDLLVQLDRLQESFKERRSSLQLIISSISSYPDPVVEHLRSEFTLREDA